MSVKGSISEMDFRVQMVRKGPQAEQWPWELGCVSTVPTVATQNRPSDGRGAEVAHALLTPEPHCSRRRADFGIISSVDLQPEHLDRQLAQKSARLPGLPSSAVTIRQDFLADTMDPCATYRKR